MFSFSLFVNLQTDKMKLIILKFHIFYTYFTIKKIILEVNKKQNKNLKQILIIYNLTGKLKIKQKQLKLQDKGNKPKRACPPKDEDINILYNRNVIVKIVVCDCPERFCYKGCYELYG